MIHYNDPDYICHHGVKGMKWGVRKDKYKSMSRADRKNTRKTYKAQKRFERNVSENWHKSYNKAAEIHNEELKKINEKYKDANLNREKPLKIDRDYVKAVNKTWVETYSKVLLQDFGTEPISKGKEWVKKAPFMNMYNDKNYL